MGRKGGGQRAAVSDMFEEKQSMAFKQEAYAFSMGSTLSVRKRACAP